MITKTIKETPSVLMLFWKNFTSTAEFPESGQFIRLAMNDSEKSISYFEDLFTKFKIDMNVTTKEEYDSFLNNFKSINSKYIHETQILNSIETSFEAESNREKKYSLGIFITKLNSKENPKHYEVDTPPLYEIYLNIEDSNNGIRFNMDKLSYVNYGIQYNLIPVAFVKEKSGDNIIFSDPDERLLSKIKELKDKIDIFSLTNKSFKYMHDFVSIVEDNYSKYGVITTPHLQMFNLINSAAENYKN